MHLGLKVSTNNMQQKSQSLYTFFSQLLRKPTSYLTACIYCFYPCAMQLRPGTEPSVGGPDSPPGFEKKHSSTCSVRTMLLELQFGGPLAMPGPVPGFGGSGRIGGVERAIQGCWRGISRPSILGCGGRVNVATSVHAPVYACVGPQQHMLPCPVANLLHA